MSYSISTLAPHFVPYVIYPSDLPSENTCPQILTPRTQEGCVSSVDNLRGKNGRVYVHEDKCLRGSGEKCSQVAEGANVLKLLETYWKSFDSY